MEIKSLVEDLTSLTFSKQVCNLLVLLGKLNGFIAINTQTCLYNCKEVEMKANHK